MGISSDHVVVLGDTNRRIGDGAILWEKDFGSGGASGSAILMLMVKGLTYAEDPAKVLINRTEVGKIYPYRYATREEREANKNHWFTQIINIGGGILKTSGANEIRIEAVGYPESGSDAFDDFYVRDVVIFFKHET